MEGGPVVNWMVFAAVVGGLAYYYLGPKTNLVPKPTSTPRDTKKEAKKAARRPEKAIDSDAQKNSKKRKVDTETSVPVAAPVSNRADDQEAIDMSTRQFVENMQRTRKGVNVVSKDTNKQNRVKTVKTSRMAGQAASSGSSQADGEAEWPPVLSPTPGGSNVDDMLEPVASGPTSLRITAPTQPVKEKVKRQPKKDQAETKKQRQNRKKVEAKSEARQAEELERKALEEKQRRTARESRGEPARNGVALPPVTNAWAEQNAVREIQNPINTTEGKNVQMLDTFETESNSSSNAENSTAATSTTDAAPSRWADDVPAGEEDFAKAVEESNFETGWAEVKTKKAKKKTSPSGSNAANTPVNEKPNPVNGQRNIFAQLQEA